jgi:hypothetical protein
MEFLDAPNQDGSTVPAVLSRIYLSPTADVGGGSVQLTIDRTVGQVFQSILAPMAWLHVATVPTFFTIIKTRPVSSFCHIVGGVY